jgi:hypothetical protein
MQINLLSILGGGGASSSDAVPSVLETTVNVDAAKAALENSGIEGEEGFTELFEGKLAALQNAIQNGEGAATGEAELPAPKMLASLLQRLHLIQAEAEGVDPALLQAATAPQLSEEQLASMAEVMGIDPQMLAANQAELAQQIFPSGFGMQSAEVESIIAALQELAVIGKSLQAQGMTLIDVSTVVLSQNAEEEGEEPLSLLSLLSKEAPLQPLTSEVSEESVRIISQLFQLPEEEILANLAQLYTVPAEEVQFVLSQYALGEAEGALSLALPTAEETKTPGLIELIARIVGKPAEEVWEQLEQATDGETDLVLDVALLGITENLPAAPRPETTITSPAFLVSKGEVGIPLTTPATQQRAPALNVPSAPEAGNPVAAPKVTPETAELAARNSVPLNGRIDVAPTRREANNIPPALEEAEAAITFQNLRPAGNNAEEAPILQRQRLNPLTALGGRPDANRATTSLASNEGLAPLLRESLERPLTERNSFESPASSLALSSIDSRLDFEARIRDTRSPAHQRAAANPAMMQDQLIVQVKQGVERGDSQIRVQLNPAELGKVDVRMEINADGRTHVAIIADNKDTLDLLQRDSRSLQKAFNEMGLEMSDSGMSFDLGGEFAGQQFEEPAASPKSNSEQATFEQLLDSPDELMAEVLLDGGMHGDLSYLTSIDDTLNIKV